MKVLDAVSLEERFRTALPMLTRQIEGLKLLNKSKKLSPDTEKKVAGSSPVSLFFSPGRVFCSTAHGGSGASRSGAVVA